VLPAVGWVLQRWGTGRRLSIFCAVLLTSVLFAAAHYVGNREAVGLTEVGFWFSLTFRFFAGVFFSVLFVYRGFGIAAGTHAGYDILVGLF
jgi:membrane protease YdiL (CAAX protease family)